MDVNISIRRTQHSRLSEIDFSSLQFGKHFSDHMFLADYKDGKWGDFRIVPFDYIPMHPSIMALHYGQSIFEGMKATKSQDGSPLFFRPEMHALRLNRSAERMCMPTFPEDVFLEAIHALVGLDGGWIPPQEGSALYIRPLMYASDEFLGVKPSENYSFLIFTCPVGPYYTKRINLWAEPHYIRAAPGGVGAAKTAGNYAAAMLPSKLAQEKGYDQVLWLDAIHHNYVQEVGTMNIFFVIENKVITPPISEDTILHGITRDSVLTILREETDYQVEERPLRMDEVVEAYRKGELKECFGSGTAAVIADVVRITFGEVDMNLPDRAEDSLGRFVKNYLNQLRAGLRPDKFGWIVPVRMPQLDPSIS